MKPGKEVNSSVAADTTSQGRLFHSVMVRQKNDIFLYWILLLLHSNAGMVMSDLEVDVLEVPPWILTVCPRS